MPNTQYINALRLPLAALVVLIHTYNTAWRQIGSHTVDTLGSILSRTLPTFAVPLFFAISGYLFFFKQQQYSWHDYVNKLHRRSFTLLIPYVCWNIIAFALYALKDLSAGAALHLRPSLNLLWGSVSIGSDGTNWLGWHIMAGTAPVQEPLWFVRDLMLITLLTPIIYTLLHRFKYIGLILLALVYYGALWPNIGGVTFMGFWFFSLGAWCSIHRYDMGKVIARHTYIWLSTAFLVLVLLLTINNNSLHILLQHLYVFSAMAAAIGVAYRLTQHKTCKYALARTSFFIYAAHNIVLLPITNFLALHTVSLGIIGQSCAFVLCPILAIAICITVYYLLQRLLPQSCWVLTANKR